MSNDGEGKELGEYERVWDTKEAQNMSSDGARDTRRHVNGVWGEVNCVICFSSPGMTVPPAPWRQSCPCDSFGQWNVNECCVTAEQQL